MVMRVIQRLERQALSLDALAGVEDVRFAGEDPRCEDRALDDRLGRERGDHVQRHQPRRDVAGPDRACAQRIDEPRPPETTECSYTRARCAEEKVERLARGLLARLAELYGGSGRRDGNGFPDTGRQVPFRSDNCDMFRLTADPPGTFRSTSRPVVCRGSSMPMTWPIRHSLLVVNLLH